MDIPDNLIDEFGRGHSVVFVGAGLPDWKTLLRPLADDLKCSPDLDPLKIAQYYQNRHGGAGRALLAQLPAQVFFTTNFDDLLDRVITQDPNVARVPPN